MKLNLDNFIKRWKLLLLLIITTQLTFNLLFYFLDINEIVINLRLFNVSVDANNISSLLTVIIFFSYLHYKKE